MMSHKSGSKGSQLSTLCHGTKIDSF